MKLYYFETSNGRKPCAVARLLDSSVEFARVDLMKGEQKAPDFLAVNPNGKIPALVDGGMKLWESNAIMVHLARKAGSDLWPTGDRQTDVIRWMNWETAHFNRAAGTLAFENAIKPRVKIWGEPNPAAIAEAEGHFKQFAAILDDHLKGRTYIAGDTLTLADFAVASFLPYAADSRLPLDGFSEIERWHARLMDIPAWRDPFPALERAAA